MMPSVEQNSWKKRRLKFVARVTTSNVDKHIYEHELPVKLCNYTDVYYNRVISDDIEFTSGSVTPKEMENFRLRKGQVLLTKDSESWDDIAVPAYVEKDFGDVVCGYHLAVVSPNPEELDGEFLSWAAQTNVVNDQFKLAARGVTRFGLGHYALKNLEISLPPVETQRAICGYLREKTSQIDILISQKQNLLELLEERKTALMTKAVTSGCDSKVPMDASGHDWLGKVPSHWAVKRLRFVGRCQNGINIGGEYFGRGFPFVSYGDVFNNFELPKAVKGLVESSPVDRLRYSVQAGDVLFTRTSETIEEIGMSSVSTRTIEDATFAGFVIRFRPNPNTLHPQFSKYYFRNSTLRAFLVKEMNIVTRASLSQTLLGNLPVLIPPLSEQEKIAKFVDRNFDEIDTTARRIESAIKTLLEHRDSLISNAVTGGLEVA